jgi:pimeloyl-ACP methyl ester carboxylesterase
MDNRPVARRRLLQWTASGVGVAALAACTGPPDPRPAPASTTAAVAPSSKSPADRPSVEMNTGSFVSKYRKGTTTHWTVATPLLPRRGATDYPVAVFLHGLGGNNRGIFDVLGAHAVLERHLAAGGTPIAIAAVDGGDTWWHARADGSDTQSMLVKEFVPFLGARGYDLGRIGLFGVSMGGFGALLLASQARLPGIRAVAAMSPAVWDSYDARIDSAFDSPADFAAHDVFSLRPKLAATPKRIDCGTEDELIATVRDYVRGLPAPVEGGFQPGGHDEAYWRSVLPNIVSFLGWHLG